MNGSGFQPTMTDTIKVPDDIALAVLTPKAYAEDRPMHEAFRWLRANPPLAKVHLDG
ncbi:MAG: hypothetical protein JOZ27_03540, partial [Caulobacteraceae bacterium]|nr:hypothetical protein [Caulobacteraceae bacterium]